MNQPTPSQAATRASMKILPCTCESAYQDIAHGRGMRAHNPCKGADKDKAKYRCTVCRKEQ